MGRVVKGLSVAICVLMLCGVVLADSSKFRIGVIAPLTGASAAYGKYIKNGIDLAYAELPHEVREKVEVHYEDDGCTFLDHSLHSESLAPLPR